MLHPPYWAVSYQLSAVSEDTLTITEPSLLKAES
jgi:hypothetical protein